MGGGARRGTPSRPAPVIPVLRTPPTYAHLITSGTPALYGLDIETDTAVDGLDPRVATIVAIAISGDAGDHVLLGDEVELLRAADELLAAAPDGVIVTWNGSGFDLPFLATRAVANDIELGLVLRADPQLAVRSPLPGHEGAYRARWHGHQHLDAYRMFRNDLHRVVDLSCSLKSVARFVGLEPVEVDRSRIHELDGATLTDYVASDARLARQLAARRWPSAGGFVDAA